MGYGWAMGAQIYYWLQKGGGGGGGGQDGYWKKKDTIDKIPTAVRESSLEQEVPTGNQRELEQQEIEAKQVARISFIEWGGVRGCP